MNKDIYNAVVSVCGRQCEDLGRYFTVCCAWSRYNEMAYSRRGGTDAVSRRSSPRLRVT